jgi:hypothetical protein
MFTMNPIELFGVREALQEGPLNFGVGVLHLPTQRIIMRPVDEVRDRGGHVELADEHGWPPHECLGFLVARPKHECVIVNLSQLNSRLGSLSMPQALFRKILLSLRQCWAEVAAGGALG